MALPVSPHRPRRAFVLPMLAAATIFAASACGSDESANNLTDVDTDQVEDVVDTVAAEVDATSEDLADTLRANGLDSIAGVVDQIDVAEWLGDGEFTFFAPNNEAFLGLDAEQAADLLTDPAQILVVLRNHTLADTVGSDELVSMQTVETEAGSTVDVTANGDEILLGGFEVVSTDIDVGGGVIHVVDGLLLP